MAQVTKHHSKEEGESYHVESGRVHLFVIWGSICDHYLMEGPAEVVELEI
jgi:hypothetical protein